MFFTIIGVGVFAYGCFYTLASALFDCDVQLGFLEKFGKSPRKLNEIDIDYVKNKCTVNEHEL